MRTTSISGELAVIVRGFIRYHLRYKAESKRLEDQDGWKNSHSAWFNGLAQGYLSAARCVGYRLKQFRDMEDGL